MFASAALFGLAPKQTQEKPPITTWFWLILGVSVITIGLAGSGIVSIFKVKGDLIKKEDDHKMQDEF
jgi:hypothetical protein